MLEYLSLLSCALVQRCGLIWVNCKDFIHRRQAQHLIHQRGQACQLKLPILPKGFAHGNKRAKTAGIQEGHIFHI